jgi:hypothetical protein
VDRAMVREAEADQAEAVLAVRLSITGVVNGEVGRYPLARTRPRPPAQVVESVTHNPDGSITTVETATFEMEGEVAHSTHADGRTADGRGFGYGLTVIVEGRSADAAAVHLLTYWTARDGRQGNSDGELVVPWLGTARVELGGGGWATAEITPVGRPAEPHAAADRGLDGDS